MTKDIITSGVFSLGSLGGDGASTKRPTRRWGGITGRSLVVSDPDFPTLDPSNKSANIALSEGDLKITATSSAWGTALTQSSALIGPNDRVYFEWWASSQTGNTIAGVASTLPSSSFSGSNSTSWGAFKIPNSDWGAYHNGGLVASLTSPATVPGGIGIIGMCAVDRTTGRVHYGYNGVWWTSSSSTGSTLGTYAAHTNLPQTGDLYVAVSASSALEGFLNLGQDHTFGDGLTALTTPYTDGDGNGEFYYPPPTGYKALATYTDVLPTTVVMSLAEHYQTKL
jgi:hypothetical protein